jgi:hypothetical protein
MSTLEADVVCSFLNGKHAVFTGLAQSAQLRRHESQYMGRKEEVLL